MSDSYRFFAQQLTKGYDYDGNPIDIQKVLQTLEHALQAVMINLGDSDDPYLIFESLNFKGEPLYPSGPCTKLPSYAFPTFYFHGWRARKSLQSVLATYGRKFER
jgi:hypothetical protein